MSGSVLNAKRATVMGLLSDLRHRCGIALQPAVSSSSRTASCLPIQHHDYQTAFPGSSISACVSPSVVEYLMDVWFFFYPRELGAVLRYQIVQERLNVRLVENEEGEAEAKFVFLWVFPCILAFILAGGHTFAIR